MRSTSIKILVNVIFIVFFICNNLNAQPHQIMNTAELKVALEKLDVLGSVLYIGAHPDDENTGLIAYLSKGRKYRTAYLSLTRGDGGQNLIGSETGSLIGLIRTQELLEARKIDGGEQFFTRAVDFGYSKSAEESLSIWNKDSILADIVWVIRNYKPDIIISRFPLNGGGHGHHIASSGLANEAFTAAADPNRFPEQLKYVKPWAAKRLFWNSFMPSQSEIQNAISVDVGEFSPLLGKSYSEIAAESRSMHKSQGFGTSPTRGSRMEYFQLIKGEPADKDIFDGINTTWDRIPGAAHIRKEVEEILHTFNPDNPPASLNKMINLYGELSKLKDGYWVDSKKKELLNIIKSCAGLWLEASVSDFSVSPGDMINIKVNLINRSPAPLKIDKIEFNTLHADTTAGVKLENNRLYTYEEKIRVLQDYPFSQPYWLNEEPSEGLFHVSNQQLIGMAENPPAVPVKIHLDYNGEKLVYDIPLIYKWNDKVRGELYRPVEIRPPATVSFTNSVMEFPDNNPKEITLRLRNNRADLKGEIVFHSEGDWKVTPSVIPFSFKEKYDEQLYTIKITPSGKTGNSVLKAEVNTGGKKYNLALVEISYPHIKNQVYFPASKIKLVKLDLKKLSERIGYIMGSGDDIPECLREIGYNVTLLTDEMLEKSDLSKFDVIITGIRAYNTRDRLKYYQPRLMEYVEKGGTLIAQYNVTSGLQMENIGPYPFKINTGRISTEDSPVNFLDPESQLLNFPNKITENDFTGWVQERGLYFADQWDPKYKTILSGNDPNEAPLKGGLLFTNYGKGKFIFTAFSWFRQLPAGVPGAYRIFVNLISAGAYNGKLPN